MQWDYALPACVDISNCALLVQSIHLLELVVSEGFVDIVADVLGSGSEVLLKTHSDMLWNVDQEESAPSKYKTIIVTIS